MKPISYRPEIDGLRALAILPVIIFHFGASWLPGGFVGVDVFFVISGYLITAILLKEHAAGTFSFKEFWLRRIRRILPAMLLMLLVTSVAGMFILFGASRTTLGWQSLSAIGMSANVMMRSLTKSYWSPSAETLPLLHTWSLSVEEQFYLIYPILLLACFRWFPKRLLACLVGLCGFSFVVCLITSFKNPSSAFYLLPNRAWELAAGCCLAAWPRSRVSAGDVLSNQKRATDPMWYRFLPVLGIALIVASWFLVKGKGFPGYMALLPVLGAVLIIRFAGEPGCVVTSLLSLRVMCFIGTLSYSLYLWHWPVIVLWRAAENRWEHIPAWPCVVLIPVLALIAYYLVERPGRYLRNPLPWVTRGAFLVLAMSATLLLSNPFCDVSRFQPTEWGGSLYSVTPRTIPFDDLLKAKYDGTTMALRQCENPDAYAQGGVIKRYGGGQPDILVLGDSHSLMWSPAIDEICRQRQLTAVFYGAEGVSPLPAARGDCLLPDKGSFRAEEWSVFQSNRVALIEQYHPRLIVIGFQLSGALTADEISGFLEEVTRINRSAKSGRRSEVLFIEDPPEISLGGISAPHFFANTSSTTVRAKNLGAQERAAAMLREISQRFEGVHTVKTADLFLAVGDRVTARNGKAIFYIDDDHLSLAGARLAEERIGGMIAGIMERRNAN